jgi:hypothetical protein
MRRSPAGGEPGRDDRKFLEVTRQFKDPKRRTGAYYQFSYTRQIKGRSDYIPSAYVPQLRREIRLCQRFRAFTARWVALSIEQSRSTMQAASRQR